MRKIRLLLVTAVAAATLSASPPASASCETELGDVCKVVDTACTALGPKVGPKVGCEDRP